MAEQMKVTSCSSYSHPRTLTDSVPLGTKDVVKTYSLMRLYVNHGLDGINNFNLYKFKHLQSNPVFFTINSYENELLVEENFMHIRRHICDVMHLAKCQEAAKYEYNKHMYGDIFNFSERCEVRLSTPCWRNIAKALAVTACLVEQSYITGKCEQMIDLINWCCLFFQSCGIDSWISCQGGWERMMR